MIQITLNGEARTLASPSLTTAMAEWGYTVGACAVAINGEFIPHPRYATVQLAEGDSLQIVVPMQGG